MKQMAIRIVVAMGLVVLGWTAGRAAQTRADFEIQVTAPNGETTVTCVRGCGLQFIRYAPSKASARPSFEWSCQDPKEGRCGAHIQGWVLP